MRYSDVSRAGNPHTPSGKAVATIALATKTSWMSGDQRQERTEWHRIQAWANLAEYAAGFKKERTFASKANFAPASMKPKAKYVIVASSIINLGQRNSASESKLDDVNLAPDEIG